MQMLSTHLARRRCTFAVFHNRARTDVLDFLLSARANIDGLTIEGSTPHRFAVLFPGAACSDIVATLLQREAAKDAVSPNGFRPLHLAARHGDPTGTRALLAAGADAKVRVGYGMLATLNVAAWHGQVEVIKELARPGVNMNVAPEASGCTALHQAAWKNQAGAVDAVVEAGASVTAQTGKSGGTPLHMAAEYLALEALHALLRHEAPVRACRRSDGVGRSSEPPPHNATSQGGKKGAVEVVELLVRRGADEFKPDDHGNTAVGVLGADDSQIRVSRATPTAFASCWRTAPPAEPGAAADCCCCASLEPTEKEEHDVGVGARGRGRSKGRSGRGSRGRSRGCTRKRQSRRERQDTGQRADDGEDMRGAPGRAAGGGEGGGWGGSDGDVGAGLGSDAVPSLDYIHLSADTTAMERRGKYERTTSKAATLGKGRSFRSSGCGRGGRSDPAGPTEGLLTLA